MVYFDEIRLWKIFWLIEVKVFYIWKLFNVSFGESLEIVLLDKKVIINVFFLFYIYYF